MENSKRSLAIINAYELGYKADENGNIYFKDNKYNLSIDKNGYYYFSRRTEINGKSEVPKVRVHRFIAYLKYGDKIFEAGVVVRHKNGNCLDNSFDNILIGTQQENMMDVDSDVRKARATHASTFVKKHNHEEIINMRKEGKSYAEIKERFNISKGTISYIINKSEKANN